MSSSGQFLDALDSSIDYGKCVNIYFFNKKQCDCKDSKNLKGKKQFPH